MKRYRSRRGERGLIASRFLFFPGGQRGESLACLWHETGLMAPFFFCFFSRQRQKGCAREQRQACFFSVAKRTSKKMHAQGLWLSKRGERKNEVSTL